MSRGLLCFIFCPVVLQCALLLFGILGLSCLFLDFSCWLGLAFLFGQQVRRVISLPNVV